MFIMDINNIIEENYVKTHKVRSHMWSHSKLKKTFHQLRLAKQFVDEISLGI